MYRSSIALLVAIAGIQTAGAYSVEKSPSSSANARTVSRRESFARVVSTFGGIAGIAASAVLPANALPSEETPRTTTRMGGLLERYQDQRGWVILAPSGWNKFEGEVGAYDVKWQDLVDPKENIKVSSTPVKSTTTSISALLGEGENALSGVEELGKKLASKRSAKLISATERLTDDVLFYEFDFAIEDGTHQLLSLSVNKGKIWSLDANTIEKRWSKREEMYKNVLGSFMPKLS